MHPLCLLVGTPLYSTAVWRFDRVDVNQAGWKTVLWIVIVGPTAVAKHEVEIETPNNLYPATPLMNVKSRRQTTYTPLMNVIRGGSSLTGRGE